MAEIHHQRAISQEQQTKINRLKDKNKALKDEVTHLKTLLVSSSKTETVSTASNGTPSKRPQREFFSLSKWLRTEF